MAKKEKITDTRTCSMCIESSDWHCLNNNHQPFLCRCRFHKWDRFLYKTMDVCAHFYPRDEFKQQLIEQRLFNPYEKQK